MGGVPRKLPQRQGRRHPRHQDQEEPLEQVVSNGHDGAVSGSAFYSYAVLSAGIDELPENVDPGKREEFLTDTEFLEVLGMDREAWAQIPGWKQMAAKRAKNL